MEIVLENKEHNPTIRVLKILEVLASNPKGLNLTEISENIESPKSTIFPIVQTMVKRKFLFFNENTYNYTIGINLFCIGSAYTSNMNAVDFIKSEMRYIVDNTNEICQMGILDRGEVLYVAKIDCNNPIHILSHVGKRLPAYCTALGKAMICNKTLDELKNLYPDGLTKYTKNTITDINILFEELKNTRKTMIASENEEINKDIGCIAVPLSKDNNIISAISVSIPSFRMTEEKNNIIKNILLESKFRIEKFFKENNIDKNQLTIVEFD